MLLVILIFFDIALFAWSLHLMRSAFQYQEFSLMLAGILVALSAAAILVSYWMMGNCLGYIN
ncbi:MAG: hypothetical protein BRC33_11600 [Cyanobacteria bacterium SW_9_44_58]|nr:MAG: hypothetical protein BRC33_11600 [Cyanobacteria bacterium SW_9_44_58]